jgi:flagellar biosynthesis regulator FlaF
MRTQRSPLPIRTTMHKIPIYLLALATLTPLLVAQILPDAGVKQFPPQARAIDDVLVPVPSEIFNTLDKFAHSNWRAVQRPELAQWRPHGDQAEIALLLGAVIAEGFIAVEAEDTAETKNVGRAVLTLARGLGVEKAVLRRSRSIVEHAERGDWPAVRKEWDSVLPDVDQGMNELKSEQLAQLVSLGGWLRGTEALSVLVLQNYTAEDAALLRQPVLLDYVEKQLAGMSGDMRTKPILARMREGLQKIRLLLASEDTQISQKKVKEIAAISEDLLKGLGPKGRRG